MTRDKRRLLLLSSSRTAGTEYLEHARDYLRSFLNARARTLLFVPYARVSNNYDDYLERVRTNFAAIGYEVAAALGERSGNHGAGGNSRPGIPNV